MVFLFVFGVIAAIFISLNIIDGSNLEKIENHFKSLNCQNIVYSKGIYKGVCEDKVMQISNSFTVDLEKNKTSFKLKEIEDLKTKNLTIIINNSYNIEFKKKENMDNFYKILKEKKNKWKKL